MTDDDLAALLTAHVDGIVGSPIADVLPALLTILTENIVEGTSTLDQWVVGSVDEDDGVATLSVDRMFAFSDPDDPDEEGDILNVGVALRTEPALTPHEPTWGAVAGHDPPVDDPDRVERLTTEEWANALQSPLHDGIIRVVTSAHVSG